MKLKHVITKAINLENDSLIYLPDEKRFFWVDDIDITFDKVICYFEEGIDAGRLNDPTISFNVEDDVWIIVQDLHLSKMA